MPASSGGFLLIRSTGPYHGRQEECSDQAEREAMRRSRSIHRAALTGALALAVGVRQPTFAAAPQGFSEVAMSGASGSTLVTGSGAGARYELTAIGEDIGGAADRGYFLYK